MRRRGEPLRKRLRFRKCKCEGNSMEKWMISKDEVMDEDERATTLSVAKDAATLEKRRTGVG